MNILTREGEVSSNLQKQCQNSNKNPELKKVEPIKTEGKPKPKQS